MNRKSISRMLKKDLIREIQAEKTRNRRKEQLVQDVTQMLGLRKQLHEEMSKTEELREKIELQDMIIKPNVDIEKRKLTEKLNKISEMNKCSICWCHYGSDRSHRVVSLKCGHLFGEKCIRIHLRTKKNCPICSLRAIGTDLRVIIAGKNLCTADSLSL